MSPFSYFQVSDYEIKVCLIMTCVNISDKVIQDFGTILTGTCPWFYAACLSFSVAYKVSAALNQTPDNIYRKTVNFFEIMILRNIILLTVNELTILYIRNLSKIRNVLF